MKPSAGCLPRGMPLLRRCELPMACRCVPGRPALSRTLRSSRSRHEQESSQHMAAAASYLASRSPSPSPLKVEEGFT
ncbi:hypothetical protein EYF80_013839 [Liparis tanakae]|uniref:Uncharacterized protein n=1 Tax=Liparis tanakae TaxID=230148 RepID=A0A4Z2ICR9_9TELE|nr:hypothetical protein EYF80_013839 [Liparis tanakae]